MTVIFLMQPHPESPSPFGIRIPLLHIGDVARTVAPRGRMLAGMGDIRFTDCGHRIVMMDGSAGGPEAVINGGFFSLIGQRLGQFGKRRRIRFRVQ